VINESESRRVPFKSCCDVAPSARGCECQITRNKGHIVRCTFQLAAGAQRCLQVGGLKQAGYKKTIQLIFSVIVTFNSYSLYIEVYLNYLVNLFIYNTLLLCIVQHGKNINNQLHVFTTATLRNPKFKKYLVHVLVMVYSGAIPAPYLVEVNVHGLG